MPSHNDMGAMVDRMHFDGDQPAFYMLNVGETHYPYALPHEDPKDWPRISGVHGVFKHMGDPAADAPEQFFDQAQLDELRQRQVDAVAYLDENVFPRLFEKLPADTWVVVTADHGELFGEDGLFGHGPIQHPKVTEVPFVEGLAP
jgi:arylsulfatase A-like enzyme